jgi:hypothetical protein
VKNPSLYYKNNVIATVSLLDKLIECGVKTFVYSSSAATYGDPGMKLCKESDWPNPISAYGASKLMMEMLCKDYLRAYGLSSVGLRYFNAAGADPEAEVGELTRERNTHHTIGHRCGQTRQDIQDVWRQVPNRGRNLCERLRTRDGPSGCSYQGTELCIRKSSSRSVQLGIRCTCIKSTTTGRSAETHRRNEHRDARQQTRRPSIPGGGHNKGKGNIRLGANTEFGIDNVVATAVQWYNKTHKKEIQ